MASGNLIRFGAVLDNKVSGELAKIRKGFDDVGQSKGFQSFAMGIGLSVGMAAFNALASAAQGAISFLQDSIGAASDLNETLTKSQQIFGPASQEIEDWAGTMASSFGQSKKDALDMASTFAGLFQTVGVQADDSARRARELTELGSDLASFFNTDVAQAVGAIRSGLAGESEPLRKFNVFLSETAVSAKAAEMGLTKVGGKLTEQQKIMARYAIIMDQTAAAQGDFGRTSDGLANQQRALDAELANLSTTIGQDLLPVMLELVTFIRQDVVPGIAAFWRGLKDLYAFMEDPGGDWKRVDDLEAVAEFLGTPINTESFETAVEDVSKAVAEGAGAFDRYSEGAMIGMEAARQAVVDGATGAAEELDKGKRNILSSARDLVSKLKSTFTMRGDWDAFVGDLTDFLERFSSQLYGDDQEGAQAWVDKLTATLESPMTGAEREKLLADALNLTGDIGMQLRDGLNNSDPLIREAAKNALASIPELLRDLQADSRGYGYNTGKAYAQGLTESAAAIEQAAKNAVYKAKQVFAASSPPGPESPLHEIDVWGQRTGEAWAEGLVAGLETAVADVRAVQTDLGNAISEAPRIEASTGQILEAPTGNVRTVWDVVTKSALVAEDAIGQMTRASVSGFEAMANALALGRASVVAAFRALFEALVLTGERVDALIRLAIAGAGDVADAIGGEVVAALDSAGYAIESLTDQAAALTNQLLEAAAAAAQIGAKATVPAGGGVTSPGTLDQADIDALNRYIGNLQAIDDRTAAQQAQLDMYIDRLGDYQERLAGTRATGGPVLPGRTYLVGESGPEYLTMGGSGGYVSPNYGQPVVIQLTVDGRELARVVDKRLYAVYRSTGS